MPTVILANPLDPDDAQRIGLINRAYAIGELVTVDDSIAAILIRTGYARSADAVDQDVLIFGDGPPTAETGVNGQWYLDTLAEVLYGPKSGGYWPADVVRPGKAISSAVIDGAGHLVITYSTGESSDLGLVKGPKGDQGLQGPDGPQGAIGPQGPDGPQGIKGDQGDQGIQGVQGTGVSILGSFTDASQLPATASPGDAYLIDGDLWVWDDTNGAFTNVGSIQGPQGDPGLQGAGATVAVVETLTGAPGEAAAVENVGTAQDAELRFTVPRGTPGTPGTPGAQGAQGLIGEGYGGGFLVVNDPAQPLVLDVQSRWGQDADGVYYQEAGAAAGEAVMLLPDLETGQFTTFRPGQTGGSPLDAKMHDVVIDGGTTTRQALDVLYGGAAAVGDATPAVKGLVQLAGDLGGTADAPTVPGLAGLDTRLDTAEATLATTATVTYVDDGDTAAKDRANHTGTQLATTISDFAETARDVIGTALQGGTNVTVTSNDAGDVITIDSTGGGGGSGNVVVHGADPNVARPVADGPVVWFGSVDPVNADDTRDVTIPVVDDNGDGFVELVVNDAEVAAVVNDTTPSATRTAISNLADARIAAQVDVNLLALLNSTVAAANVTTVEALNLPLTPGLWTVEVEGQASCGDAGAATTTNGYLIGAGGLTAAASSSGMGTVYSGLASTLYNSGTSTSPPNIAQMSYGGIQGGANAQLLAVTIAKAQTTPYPFRLTVPALRITVGGTLKFSLLSSVATNANVFYGTVMRARKIAT